jgi:CDGSH iron-sulfur domain-containing protein 3
MPDPARGGELPIKMDVKAGETYWWCTCGLSQNQPFCDGSHKADDIFAPQAFTPDADKTVFFCTCKATKKGPLCDGSHNVKP